MMLRYLAACLGLLISFGSASAEILRVATWNLEEASSPRGIGNPTSRADIFEAGASSLKRLNPDIICLQGVSDWETCEKLCSLIGAKNYHVVTCSAFSPDVPQAEPGRQVAILARQRAILAWTEKVGPAAGFALAVTPRGTQKVAIFSVWSSHDRKTAIHDELSERLLGEVNNLDQFRTNRPDALVILGTRPETVAGLANASLGRAGFESVHVGTARESGHLPDILARNAGFVTFPRVFEISLSKSSIVSCDIELGAASSAATLAARKPLVLPGDPPIPTPTVALVAATPPPPTPTFTPPTSRVSTAWVMVVALLVLALLALIGRIPLRRRSTSMSLQVMPQGNLTPAGRHLGTDELVVITIAGWLRTRFMQRLLAQRQELIATQNQTAQRTLVIEEKLARMQSDLQDRIAGYESRIQRLETELVAATTENRDLIRDQIHLLKKQLATAREEEPYLRN